MNEGIFRKKSIDKVSSPESLNDYVKVASPSIWAILIGIIVLLVGVCIWGVTGRLDTKVSIGVSVSSDNICYISEADLSKVKIGQKFTIDGSECEIVTIDNTPIQGKDISPLMLHATKLTEDDWVYKAKVKGNLKEGEYETYILVESVSPMSFITN